MPGSTSSSSERLTPVPGRRVDTPRGALAKQIPRRSGVSWWLGILLAVGFAAVVTPAITAEHWLLGFAPGTITERHEAPFTVRAPMSGNGALRVGGGLVVARGEVATRDEAAIADAIAVTAPRGPVLYLAFFALTFVLAALFTHHVTRSTKGRLVRVQVVSLAVIVVLAAAVKLVLLSTAMSALVVPIALLAMVPTMVLDRVVGLASGVLAALVVSLLAPFDIGLALLLLVQTAAAGLVVAERPRRRWLAALTAGLVTTLCTAATYLLLTYLTSGHAPDLRDPLHSPWLAAAIGPAAAAVLAVPLIPIYQLLVGEITQSKLIALEDLGQPLLRRIAEKAPGSWQHSLMMANMAEIAANAIGANGRLVRVGAYYHDLGKSLQPKYFIENLEPGETSPHDLLPPEVSCDAIFAHVTEGIVTARKAGLHERIVDFMHMHHGNGVLEYFWAKCREQGNPRGLTVEDFRYPGHPPQSRETALLAICDAVEAASRTLKQPDPAAIDSLVQRIVYGKLHLGQLDESGLSMSDLRRISDSLRETIRHANHGRIEYPWQKAGQDASAAVMAYTTTAPRLDSLDRKPGRDSTRQPLVPELAAARPASSSDAALAVTADVAHSAPQPAEASEAARIRAGTARNAHPASEPPAAPPRENPTTLTGRAPGPSPAAGEPGAPRTVEPNASVALEAPRDPAAREAAMTLPGRAPGPAGNIEDAARAVAAAAASAARAEARPLDPRPAERRHPRPLTAPSHGYDAASTLSEAANTVTGRLAEPRAAAPPEPPDLDPPISSAPAVRRAATAPPAGPTDPAEIAAALASLVSRVAGAPFGKAGDAATVPPAGPRIPMGSDAAATQPVLPLAGPRTPAGREAMMTEAAPPLAGSRIPMGSDAAATQPVLPLAGLRAPAGREAVVTEAVPQLAGSRIAGGRDAVATGSAPPLAGSRIPMGSDAAATQPVLPLAGLRAAAGRDEMATRPVAPFAGSRVPVGSDAIATRPVPPSGGSRVPSGSDAAVPQSTMPLAGAPRAPRGTDADAIVKPSPATSGASADERGSDAAITHPVLLGAAHEAAGHPPPATREARTKPGTMPARATGLSDREARPGQFQTLRGHADEASTLQRRQPTDPLLRGATDETRAPLRRPPSDPVAAAALGTLNEDARVTTPRAIAALAASAPAPGDFEGGETEPSIPVLAIGDQLRVDLAVRPSAEPPPPPPPPGGPEASAAWGEGLAARIDVALDGDEWGKETPIAAPTKGELRALLGRPDPTRQQPVAEIERLQRRAAELADPPRRAPHPTAEVDPDDIEAAIELAPPARRPHPNAIAAPKPRKPE